MLGQKEPWIGCLGLKKLRCSFARSSGVTEIGLRREAVETLGMILTWVFCLYTAQPCVYRAVWLGWRQGIGTGSHEIGKTGADPGTKRREWVHSHWHRF